MPRCPMAAAAAEMRRLLQLTQTTMMRTMLLPR